MKKCAESFGQQECPYCGKILYTKGEDELPVCGKCVFCGKFIRLVGDNYCKTI